jgi:hypothetical protein
MQRRQFQLRSVRDIRRRGIGIIAGCGVESGDAGIVGITRIVGVAGKRRERTFGREHARDDPAVRIDADGRHHVSQRHPPHRAATRRN